MNILFRNLLRDIKKSKGQFISIMVIVILGVTFYTGLNSMFRNLSNSSDSYYKDYRLADLWIDLYKAPLGINEEVEAIPGVKKAEVRIVKDANISISEENATLRFITLPDEKRDIINDIVIKSGRYFSKGESNQCLVDQDFLIANNLSLGDYIYPIINGNKVKLKVIGSVKSPEFVYTLKDSSELIPDNKKFGVIYIKQSFGEAVFDMKGSVNSVSLELYKGSDVVKVKEDIKKALKDYGVKTVIDRDEQTSTMVLKAEIKKLKAMGGSFPIIFLMVASVIIYIMMGRMVENQRVQIGVLKALGFTNAQIMAYYMFYSAIIAVSGSIIGAVLGTYMGLGLTKVMNQYFSLPLDGVRVYIGLVLPAAMLTISFCLFAGYNSCKSVFKIMPSEAMREKVPKNGNRIMLERIKVIWININYLWKIILRNLFRYKRRALLTSLGIIFSSAILVIALSMLDSINYMIKEQYGSIQNYDIRVRFSKLINVQELNKIKNIPHVKYVEPVFESGVEISNGWRSKDVGFTSLIRDPQIYKVVDKSGNSVQLPSKGILISDKLADTLGVKANDIVTIKFFYPGKEKKDVIIKGTVVQYLGLSSYTSMDNLNNLLGEGMVANSAVIKIDDSAYENIVKSELRDMASVNSVESKTDSLNALLKNMGASKSSVGVLIILAAILLIAVVYNTASINIFERQRELASLKVLGFKDNEIKKLIFNENYIITIFGIMVGVPLGRYLGYYIMLASSTDAYSFPYVVEFKTYIITIVLTLLFTFSTNLFLMKKVKSIDMIEVLKNKE